MPGEVGGGFQFDGAPASFFAGRFPEVADFGIFQQAANKGEQGLGNNEGDGAGAMFSEQTLEGSFHAVKGHADRFPFGRADGLRIFLQLAIDLGLAVADFVDEFAVPQAVVEILKFDELFDPETVVAGQDGRCLFGTAARGGIDLVDFGLAQLLHNAGDLQAASFTERDIESPFDAALLIKIGGARANEEDAYHRGEDVLIVASTLRVPALSVRTTF